jgi:uncharacterized protein (TIGR02246 family)
MKTKNMFRLVLCILLVFSLSVTSSAKAASAEEEVIQVATNWIKAFNNRDFELMSSLYWHSPKLSGFGPGKDMAFLDQGWESSEKSFKSMFALPEGTYMLTQYHPQATMLGDSAAVITQYFIGVVTDPNSKKQSVGQIRQTFVVQKMGGKWLIVHDHGSNFPVE